MNRKLPFGTRIQIALSALVTLMVCAGASLTPSPAQAQWAPETTITSETAGVDHFFGQAVATVGTINGTSILVLGAPGAADEGRAYLVNASSGNIRATLTSPNGDFGGEFGAAVGTVGDITGDGFPDVIVGAPQEAATSGENNAGATYLYDGDTGAFIRTLQTSSANIDPGRRLGSAVAGVGDIDGGGDPDILVGAPFQAAGGAQGAGRAYLFRGEDGSVIRTITGGNVDTGRFGTSVAGVGNLVGDATPDLLIGAPRENATAAGSPLNEAGRVYLIDGSGTLGPTVITSSNVETGGQFGNSVASFGPTD